MVLVNGKGERMVDLPKSKVNLKDITGPYPLLGLFLIVVEALLGFWMYQADNALERTGAGLLMTVLLVVFLFVVMRMEKEGTAKDKIVPSGLKRELKPAQQEATEKEIESPEPQRIGSTDGLFSINKPPDEWTVDELGFADWGAKTMQLDNASTKQILAQAEDAFAGKILYMKSGKELSFVPVPGKTLVDGRRIPTGLRINVATELSVVPINRAQKPFFIQRPMTHNFITFIGGMSGMGHVTMHRFSAGLIPNSTRPYMLAEFKQELKDCIINDKAGQDMNININYMGIEGEINDYLLVMRYPSKSINNDPELENDLHTLQSLVNSFRPLKIASLDEKRHEIEVRNEEDFEKAVSEMGSTLFLNEFMVLLDAIKQLEPFSLFAKEIDFHEEDLDELWEAMNQAKKGEAAGFKEILDDLIKVTLGEQKLSDEDILKLPEVEGDVDDQAYLDGA
jgi:hypothetical protein